MAKVTNNYGEVYGYARVSTKEQNLDRQLDAMLAYGVKESHIFAEKESGKSFNREAYKKLIHVVRKGDIIVIKSIDRLGRNYQDIIDQWRMITQDIGCGIHVIDMPSLNTSGDPSDLLSRFITDMMLQVLSFVAENERENTLRRQREGFDAAKKRGTIKIGRPRAKIPFEFWDIFVAWKTGAAKTEELGKYYKEKYGQSMRTFYRRLRELDMRYGDIPPYKLQDYMVEDDFFDGIDFDFERCEAAVGIYNSYITDPSYRLKYRKEARERREADPDGERRREEEEIRQIVLAKRQAEFKAKFGIEDTPEEEEQKLIAKRGRIAPQTERQRIALKEARESSSKAIKTTIVD